MQSLQLAVTVRAVYESFRGFQAASNTTTTHCRAELPQSQGGICRKTLAWAPQDKVSFHSDSCGHAVNERDCSLMLEIRQTIEFYEGNYHRIVIALVVYFPDS